MNSLPPSRFFPPADSANEEGLVGAGGRLSPEWLLDAYSHGIFPWPIGEEDDPMLWWSLDPRAIIEFDSFHVSRRLRRTCRSGRFTLSIDRDFAGVIHGCAAGRSRQGGTWITPAMIEAYSEMHRLGHAHSVEAWQDGHLAGGVYGIAIGGLFAAESMFFPPPRRIEGRPCSIGRTPPLTRLPPFRHPTANAAYQRLGAVEISRDEYLRRLADALEANVTFGHELQCG